MKILIVDDSLANLRMLRALLELEDFQVIEALDGVAALEALERDGADAIISDILMPRMDGYRLCHEVRRSLRWHELPFIFYTGTYTSTHDEKLCYDIGGDKYLQKPASSEVIFAALKDAAKSGAKPRITSAPPSESDVMKEYSERLIAKLESRNIELAQTTKRLEESNRELAARSVQLEQIGAELKQANTDLDSRVRQRTADLEATARELESFSFSVSHDLRAPLRHIAGFANNILENAEGQLDAANLRRLNTICQSAQKMSEMIEALLNLATVTRAPLNRSEVDLTALAAEIVTELKSNAPGRAVKIQIAPGLTASADARLLQMALTNLLGNAWKFTSRIDSAEIEFGKIQKDGGEAFFVRDNGAGFDMTYARKLFTAFHRMHTQEEFEGTGIGLATVQRIIHRHGGRIWADAAPNKGATFYFTPGETTS